MYRPLPIFTLILGLLILLTAPAAAQAPEDCEISPDTLAGIRQMLTAEDNGVFFELWTPEEIACACIEIYYNDPQDAGFHDRVVAGAVVLLGMTEDARAVPVLIDAINTHPAQALYALGAFPRVESLSALVGHIRDDDPSARENAAEGLRRMQPPPSDDIQEGWKHALESALDDVADWMVKEPEPDIAEYFLDAHHNLSQLLAKASVSQSGTN